MGRKTGKSGGEVGEGGRGGGVRWGRGWVLCIEIWLMYFVLAIDDSILMIANRCYTLQGGWWVVASGGVAEEQGMVSGFEGTHRKDG
jgi:hypothetical protein